MSTVEWVPCITEDDEMHEGWRRRHSWQNTGLDIVADELVTTRRCVWCNLRQHSRYVQGTRPKTWRNTPGSEHAAAVLEAAGDMARANGDTRIPIGDTR